MTYPSNISLQLKLPTLIHQLIVKGQLLEGLGNYQDYINSYVLNKILRNLQSPRDALLTAYYNMSLDCQFLHKDIGTRKKFY
jgi:hypothetical protein